MFFSDSLPAVVKMKFLLFCLILLISNGAILQSGGNESAPWIVDPSWVRGQLTRTGLILVDCRADHEYVQGHLPGAILLDMSDLAPKTDEVEMETFRNELANRFSLLGYSGKEQLVFYDEGGGTKAPRCLWNFLYAGGKQASLMQGGWNAWKRAGFPMAWDRAERQHREFPFQEDPNILATSDYVASRIRDFSTTILDVRSRAEFDGISQAHPASRLGHIPGAKWLEWTELLDNDHFFLPEALQREKLEKAGITPDKEIVVYCHRGNRASNTFLALKALGYPNVKEYIGSWSDWAARLDLPLEKKEIAPPEENP